MRPEEKRQGAFEDFDDLLTSGLSVDEAIDRAAMDNELRPDVFRTIAVQNLGNLEIYRLKIQSRFKKEIIEIEVKSASLKKGRGLADGYDLQEVAAEIQSRFRKPTTDADISQIQLVRKDFVKSRLKNLLARIK